MISAAMRTAMEMDPAAIMFGDNIVFEVVFRCSQGLREEFGEDWVFITPFSDNGIMASHGWAAALTGPWFGLCLARLARWHLAS